MILYVICLLFIILSSMILGYCIRCLIEEQIIANKIKPNNPKQKQILQEIHR